MSISVGKLYQPARTSWPQGAQYNYRAGAHELIVMIPSPTPSEVDAVKRGRAEFALYVDAPLLVLLYRFAGGIEWSDAPYSWHLVPEQERDLPSADLGAQTRAQLTTILLDAATGIVQAIRLTTLGPAFTRALHAAIRDQASAPWDAARYDGTLAAMYRRYPTSEQLRAACTLSTRGGD